MKITDKDVNVPADVPAEHKAEYVKNYIRATRSTGRLMLFAGDQKIEHLNDDFFGATKEGPIADEDANPEHLFRIANQGSIGIFATQLGMIARYGADYPDVAYIVKMNSKSHLVKTAQAEPLSQSMVDFEDVLSLKKNSKLNIVGVGYTVYAGSEQENAMFQEAGRLATKAHQHGMIAVFWMYPRGKAVPNETDPHIVAGAAGVGACLGADFVKVNFPKKEGASYKEICEAFREAIKAAGRTKVITSGGSSKEPKVFLEETYQQIHISGAMGNATGRNIHQKSLAQAVKFCDAISSITLGNHDADFAYKVYLGEEKFRI